MLGKQGKSPGVGISHSTYPSVCILRKNCQCLLLLHKTVKQTPRRKLKRGYLSLTVIYKQEQAKGVLTFTIHDLY